MKGDNNLANDESIGFGTVFFISWLGAERN